VTTHIDHPWRRLAALGIGFLAAVAVATVATLAVHDWAAVGLGVVVGQVVSFALVTFDERHFPDHVVILASGRR
jgi:tetrahydromethanopterin S-methyltransferase subunit C